MGLLHGVRILDLTRLLPGAYATLLLADLGADVIKIEDPRGGDGMRRAPRGRTRISSCSTATNEASRSTCGPPARARFSMHCWHRATCVVESFRPSTARRLGVDGPTLSARHPRLICASISGFGATGPYAERAAHDINYQALAGLLITSPHARVPLSATSARRCSRRCAILGALFQRERTGQGAVVEVSIHEAALHWSMFPTTADLESACYTIYETADGHWLALGALEPKFWAGFCERIGRNDLASMELARGAERERVMREVRALMKTRTREDWLVSVRGRRCLSDDDFHARGDTRDPHLAARGVLTREVGVTYVSPPGFRYGALRRLARTPTRCSRRRGSMRLRARR